MNISKHYSVPFNSIQNTFI